MKKFLLIDDHFVVRSGVKGLLGELYKPCEVYEADDSEKAIDQLKADTADGSGCHRIADGRTDAIVARGHVTATVVDDVTRDRIVAAGLTGRFSRRAK